VTRALIPLGELHRSSPNGIRTTIALTQDGTSLAHLTFSPTMTERRRNQQTNETTQNLRTTSQFESLPLSVIGESPSILAFSPDGTWIAYKDDYQLMKIPVNGGTPQVLSQVDDNEQAEGISWSENDFLYIVENRRISRISAAGGPIQSLGIERLHGDQGWQAFPHALPGSYYHGHYVPRG
jgi:hypothetical protein